MTRPYAEVIGDPISHSKSPLIHNFWLTKLGIDAEYRACHVRKDELEDYVAQRRGDAEWHGCNITIPHKVEAMRFADGCDSTAQHVGATNCLIATPKGIVAHNTDTAGVFAALPDNVSPVCMIGAGGAARAVMPILDFWASAWNLRVIARDRDKAAANLDPGGVYKMQFFTFKEAELAMRGARGVINASPLGMIGQPPMPSAILHALNSAEPGAWVFDMVYAPLDTELLKTAHNLGLSAVDGLTMLIGQAAAAFELFFGRPTPREHDAELRALLTA